MEILKLLLWQSKTPTRQHKPVPKQAGQCLTLNPRAVQSPCSAKQITEHLRDSSKNQDFEAKPTECPKTLAPLATNFVVATEINISNLPSQVQLGFLVGIINPFHLNEDILGNTCHKIHLGHSQQIPSLPSLRKRSLDRLIIFWHQNSCKDILQQIIQSPQRLVFIIQFTHQNTLNSFIKIYEAVLLKMFGDKPVKNVADRLMVKVTERKESLVVEVEEEDVFMKHFEGFVRENFKSFETDEENELLLELVTLDDYYLFTRQKSDSQQIAKRISQLAKSVKNKIAQAKDQEALDKMKQIGLELEAKRETEQEKVLVSPQPTRKDSSIEAELQAEYFIKRQSQQETRESGSKRLELSDLYYFIEEHDSSNSSTSSNNSTNSHCYQPSPLRRNRSKSWDSLSLKEQQHLDDQFFTKY